MAELCHQASQNGWANSRDHIGKMHLDLSDNFPASISSFHCNKYQIYLAAWALHSLPDKRQWQWTAKLLQVLCCQKDHNQKSSRSLSYKTKVTITLEYDYMCSETYFTREYKRIGLGCKVGLLYFLLTACCCSVTKWSNSGIAGSLRTWKIYFWESLTMTQNVFIWRFLQELHCEPTLEQVTPSRKKA